MCLRSLYLMQKQKINFVKEVKKRVLNVLWKHIGEDDKKIFDILCPSEIAYQRLGQLHWFHKMVLLWESFPGPDNPVTVVCGFQVQGDYCLQSIIFKDFYFLAGRT